MCHCSHSGVLRSYRPSMCALMRDCGRQGRPLDAAFPDGEHLAQESRRQSCRFEGDARATGQSADLAPELAAQFLEFYRQAIADEFRGPDPVAPFGAAITTTSGDPVAQLVAISGRTP